MLKSAKNILLILDVIPQHNGSPKSRQAFLIYRAFCCLGKTSVIVMDAHGTEYDHRAKMTADVQLVPIRTLDNEVSAERCAQEIKLAANERRRLRRAIDSSCVDFEKSYCVAQNPRLADWVRQVMPIPKKLLIVSEIEQDEEYSRTALAPLVARSSGAATTGTPERLALVLSGDVSVDQKICSAIDREISSLNVEAGLDLRVDVFGGQGLDWHGMNTLQHRSWPDLTGVLATTWLLIDLLSDETGGRYLAMMADSFGVDSASPLGFSSRSSSRIGGVKMEYETLPELGLIIRNCYSAVSAGGGAKPRVTASGIADELMQFANCFGIRVPKRSLPKTFGEFYLSGTSPRRRLPYKHIPSAYFVPATGLLCIQAFVRHSSGVNEIRILNGKRDEIGRIVPSLQRPELPYLPIEGGVILHGVDHAPSITLQFFESGRFCSEMSIDSRDIHIVDFELVSLDFLEEDLSRATGLVWSGRSGEDLELQLPPAARHRLAPPVQSGSSPNAPGWTSFDITGFVEPSARALVRLTGRDTHSQKQRPLHLGRSFTDPSLPRCPDLEQLHNVHSGRRAWIVGNGPSVRHEDLNQIGEQGDIVFCFNRFYMAYPETSLREDYVVSADRLMIEDFGQEMIDRSTGLPLFCVDRDEATKLEGQHIRLNKLDVAMPLFSTNASRFVHIGGSSVFVALQLAFHFGIREVLTYGLDYSFSQTPVFDPRYTIPVCFDEGNHFIKGYRSEKPWVPPNWRDISFGFLKSRVAFEANGGRILNATRGGKLEIFDRIDFDRVVENSSNYTGA